MSGYRSDASKISFAHPFCLKDYSTDLLSKMISHNSYLGFGSEIAIIATRNPATHMLTRLHVGAVWSEPSLFISGTKGGGGGGSWCTKMEALASLAHT